MNDHALPGKSLSLVCATAAVLLALSGCSAHAPEARPAEQPVDTSTAPAAAEARRVYPTTPAEAEAARRSGQAWSNEEIRTYYLQLAGSVDGEDAQWKQQGLSAEERARRAYAIRHNARITARAMMGDAREVEDLRARDQEKYGNPDGPTFEQLVESQRKKGLSGEAVYEALVDSSQRTDKKTNEKYNLEGAK